MKISRNSWQSKFLDFMEVYSLPTSSCTFYRLFLLNLLLLLGCTLTLFFSGFSLAYAPVSYFFFGEVVEEIFIALSLSLWVVLLIFTSVFFIGKLSDLYIKVIKGSSKYKEVKDKFCEPWEWE